MKRSVQNLAFSRFSPNQATPWTFEHLSAKDYCTRLKSEYERDVKKWMCNCSRLVLTVAWLRPELTFMVADYNRANRTELRRADRSTNISAHSAAGAVLYRARARRGALAQRH